MNAQVESEIPRPLVGLVVVVTGAGAGIGRACAERYLAEGASVVADTDDAQYRQVLALNLDAVWEAARAAIPAFVEAERTCSS